MLRYLNEPFWARPHLAGPGPIPRNAVLMASAVLLGFGEHAVWEDASLKGRPAAISANIDLVSHLLDDAYDPGAISPDVPSSETTTTPPASKELEN